MPLINPLDGMKRPFSFLANIGEKELPKKKLVTANAERSILATSINSN